MMGGAPQKLVDAALEQYKADLARHDWSYAMSDDYSVWRAGAASASSLQLRQAMYDKDAAIWNSIAPEWARLKPAKDTAA